MSDGAAKPQTNGNNTQTQHTEMSLHTNTQQMKALTAGTVWNLFGRVWPKGLKSDLIISISCPFPASYFSVLVQVSLQEVQDYIPYPISTNWSLPMNYFYKKSISYHQPTPQNSLFSPRLLPYPHGSQIPEAPLPRISPSPHQSQS